VLFLCCFGLSVVPKHKVLYTDYLFLDCVSPFPLSTPWWTHPLDRQTKEKPTATGAGGQGSTQVSHSYFCIFISTRFTSSTSLSDLFFVCRLYFCFVCSFSEFCYVFCLRASLYGETSHLSIIAVWGKGSPPATKHRGAKPCYCRPLML